jgi:hypothetical protein
MVGDRGRAAALLAAGILVLGACGGGDDEGGGGDAEGGGGDAGPPPTDVTAESVRAAADASAGVESFAYEIDMTYTGLAEVPGAPETMPDQANLAIGGVADVAAGQSQAEMDVTDMLSMMGAGGGDAEGFEGASVRTVVDGDTAYVNYGELGSSYGVEPDQWLRIGADQLAQNVGSVSGPGGLSPTDPAGFADLLRGVDADEDVVVQGEEDVRGTGTTHVIATANLEGAIAAAPAERQTGLEQQFGQLGLEEIPVHLWLAGDGLPRRVEVVAEPGDVDSLGGVGLSVVVESYDYGEPVEVEVPVEGLVVDGDALTEAPPAEG